MPRHRKPQTIIGVLICILWLEIPCFESNSFELTLVSHEGDSVFLPCSYPLASSLSIVWEVNDVTFSMESLPNQLQRVSSGLFIRDVSLQDAGDYNCYTYSMSNLEQLYSNHLVVIPSESDYSSGTIGQLKTDLNIDRGLNFQATENDVIFLPCVPAIGTHAVTLWRIDGVIYPVTELPRWHSKHYGGIIVNPAMSSTTGTVYECYTTVDNSIGLLYTVSLSLRPSIPKDNETLHAAVYSQSNTARVKLISRLVNLTLAYKEFGFKIQSEVDSTSLGAEPDIFFITDVIKYGKILWDDLSNIMEPIFSIPSKHFQDIDAYGTTYAKNLTNGDNEPFATLGYLYRTDVNETTNNTCIPEGQTSCVYLPENKNDLRVMWPTHPKSDDDCICPVFAERELGPTFKSCYCFVFNLTTYNIELQDNDRICWKSLDRDSNDTKILLVKEELIGNFDVRVIESQNRIIVQGPTQYPPNITYNSSNNSVCATSKSEEWSPVIGTVVLVNDATGDTILDRAILKLNFCLELDALPQSCAPFQVKMIAFSQCVHSEPSIFQGQKNGNICQCLQDKVNLTFNISHTTYDEIIVTIHSSCLNLKDYEISNVFLKATQLSNCGSTCKNASTYFDLFCAVNQPFNIYIMDLIPGTNYEVSIEWMSPTTGQHCLIAESQQSMTLTEDSSNLMLILSLSVPIGTILLIIVFIVLFSFAVRNCRKNLKSKNLLINFNE